MSLNMNIDASTGQSAYDHGEYPYLTRRNPSSAPQNIRASTLENNDTGRRHTPIKSIPTAMSQAPSRNPKTRKMPQKERTTNAGMRYAAGAMIRRMNPMPARVSTGL